MTASTFEDPRLAEALSTGYWREGQARVVPVTEVVLDTCAASRETAGEGNRVTGEVISRNTKSKGESNG
jgi:hypothetical protein